MRIVLISFVTTSMFFYTACKKADVKSNTDTDNCVTANSLDNGSIIDGQYIVAYKTLDNFTNPSAQRIAQVSKDVLSQSGIKVSVLKSSFNGSIKGFVANLSSKEAALLRANSLVETVEPDRLIAFSGCFTIAAPSLITWNINKVGYGNGIGKTAWILDTGIDFNHPDLNVDTIRSRSFISSSVTANDENGHGTHVAGIIGAKNNNFGVLGVASGATLVPLKVLGKDGIGTVSASIEALAYVNANGKAGDVVNMSFGEEGISDVLDRQVKAVAAKGIFIAIAAGNDSKAANLFSPARANGTNIFTVSAVDSLDNFASFSNFGNESVDYAAPGVRILSTYIGGKYAKITGTSQAAPHVAGLLLINGNNLHYSALAKNDLDGAPDKIVMK